MITITIKTDNDAFADGCEGAEVARILREYADRIDGAYSATECALFDLNGARVGAVTNNTESE